MTLQLRPATAPVAGAPVAPVAPVARPGRRLAQLGALVIGGSLLAGAVTVDVVDLRNARRTAVTSTVVPSSAPAPVVGQAARPASPFTYSVDG